MPALLSWRNGFVVVSAALIAVCVAFVCSSRGPVSEVASVGPQTVVAEASSSATPCAAELASCRAESWTLVARTIRGDIDDREHPKAKPGVRSATSGTGSSEPPAETTGPADQKRVLCSISEQQAREHWVKHKAEILGSIRDVGKESWVRAERKKTLDGLASALGADATELGKLDKGYDALWRIHGPALQAIIAKEPIDLPALDAAVRSFWRDEDRLVERIMGAHAKEEYRASEMRSRTAIAAILAALGEKPYDDSLAW